MVSEPLRDSAMSRRPTIDLPGRLRDGIERLGVAVTGPHQTRLLDYLAMLVKWNNVYNLTSVRDPADMLIVHLLDSLSILPIVDALASGAIVDVGSGAGLPGIPIAITRADRRVLTIDAVAKKIGFQLQVRTALHLDNLTPMHQRIEALTLAESPAIIVSRAYADLRQTLATIDAIAGPRTTVVAMKGVVPTQEIAALPAGWRVLDVRPLDVPFLGAERCAVLLQRGS